ncbi:MAG: OmpA family protein [Elusimicrobiaceae bacterium]|nr:OmpA family protein [Elusimicrobiaceae bacterium]
MKKLLVLLSSVLVAGCFVCHKGVQETATEKVAEPQDPVIVRYSFPEVANFEFDSKVAQVNREKMAALDKDIKAHPETVILIEGHTDNIGPEEYNDRLSVARARSMEQILEQQHYPNTVRTEGKGYHEPIASNDTREGRAQNRRVDVILIKDSEK